RVTVLVKWPLEPARIEELENSPTRPEWVGPAIERSLLNDGTEQTAICIPSLYWGVQRMFRSLLGDPAQAQAASILAEAFRDNWDKKASDVGHLFFEEAAFVDRRCSRCGSQLVSTNS